MANIPPTVKRALERELESLHAERRKICEPIDVQIAEIEMFMRGAASPAISSATREDVEVQIDIKAAREANRLAIEASKKILSNGKPLKTADLYAALASQGVHLKAGEAERRLGQLLSADDAFQSDRKHGWSLKAIAEPTRSETSPGEFDEFERDDVPHYSEGYEEENQYESESDQEEENEEDETL